MSKTQFSDTTPQLGYFLDYQYWENALALLEHQLTLKPNNKHFNTLSMFYYERLSSRDKQLLRSQKYFEQRVANNLLYGLGQEFAIHSYPIPKSNLGLRKYRFFTYPMRITYYAIGLYLLRLSQELVQNYYKSHKRIHADYGGSLLFDEKTKKMQLNYDSVWYKPHYRRFRNRVRKVIEGNVGNKVIIHIDIQNYFEEISIPILLDILTEYVKPSIQKEMKFDPITRGQIASFFEFVSTRHTGIPQTDNDVISSFLGYLYLVFGDLFLDQEVNRDSSIIQEHAIIRYMDDIYISLDFYGNIPRTDREIYLSSLASRISDCLYQRLGLRLNTKTRLFWLNKPSDVADLLTNLKKVSPGYEVKDDDNKADPNDKLDLIFKQLRKLKKSTLDPTFGERGDLDNEILKEVYDKNVAQLMNKEKNKARVQKIFDGFNFDLIIAQPREILIILLIDPSATNEFQEFLLRKKNLTSRDVYLILNFLCQTGFKSPQLVKVLQSNTSMRDVMYIFESQHISMQHPGYFELCENQILKLAEAPNVIEQIRLRVQCERKNDYSVALNHLLNEIHAICYRLDSQRINEKNYDANHVAQFLAMGKVPHETCIKIRNLFDRRNKNPVSHADSLAWPVSQDEYIDYHHHVGVCLSQIL